MSILTNNHERDLHRDIHEYYHSIRPHFLVFQDEGRQTALITDEREAKANGSNVVDTRYRRA